MLLHVAIKYLAFRGGGREERRGGRVPRARKSGAQRGCTCPPSWSHSLRARMASRGRSAATAEHRGERKEEDRREEKEERRRWERDAGSARDRMWAAVYQLEDDIPRRLRNLCTWSFGARRRRRRCARKEVSKFRYQAIFTTLHCCLSSIPFQ